MPEEKNQENSHGISPEIIAIHERLTDGEREMKWLKENLLANTKATQTIADNTQPFLELYADLAAGTRFLCRCAMSIRFVLEMVKSYYMPVLIICTFFYAVTHNLQLPEWFHVAIKAVEG